MLAQDFGRDDPIKQIDANQDPVFDGDDAYPALEVQSDELKGSYLDVAATLHLINEFLVPAWGDRPRFQPPNPAIGGHKMPLTKPGDLPLNNKSAVYSLLDGRPQGFPEVVDRCTQSVKSGLPS